jgi:hypothetical protein
MFRRKPAPDLIGGGRRFAGKNMRQTRFTGRTVDHLRICAWCPCEACAKVLEQSKNNV